MELITKLQTSGLVLLESSSASLSRPALTKAIALLALRGPVTVIDGGNTFNPYGIARHVRAQTVELEKVLNRIQLSRVFTCYQMVSALHNLNAAQGGIVLLDMLRTFADDSVSAQEAYQLLAQSVALLQGNRQALITVCDSKSMPADKQGLLPFLHEHVDEALFLYPSVRALQPQQLSLF